MSAEWAIPDDGMEKIFRRTKYQLQQQNQKIFFDWSRPALSEITPNVARTLERKFQACEPGYSATKIAALYAFWIAKLKPGFGIMTNHLVINEYLALAVGFAIIRERIGIDIHLSQGELLGICETLRYHTSSPHTMMHIFNGWVEREKLRRK